MAKYAKKLVANSPFKGRIIVIGGKLEEIEIPEQVDILISEPMGYMLYNERMLESYVHSRKFLKKNGLMFPSVGDTYCAPFTNEQLYIEQFQKAGFWCVNSFYGVNLTSLHNDAVDEYFSQPIVDQIPFDSLLCPAIRHRMDFRIANEEDFKIIEIPFEFGLLGNNLIHGFAFWFDVCFAGSEHNGKDIWLSTAPNEPLTHWYQIGCLLKNPLFGRTGETLFGKVLMEANEKQSYNIEIVATIRETGITSTQKYDLKNPFFRYTGAATNPTPGRREESPSANLWNGVTVGAHSNTANTSNSINSSSINQKPKHNISDPISNLQTQNVTNLQSQMQINNQNLNVLNTENTNSDMANYYESYIDRSAASLDVNYSGQNGVD